MSFYNFQESIIRSPQQQKSLRGNGIDNIMNNNHLDIHNMQSTLSIENENYFISPCKSPTCTKSTTQYNAEIEYYCIQKKAKLITATQNTQWVTNYPHKRITNYFPITQNTNSPLKLSNKHCRTTEILFILNLQHTKSKKLPLS